MIAEHGSIRSIRADDIRELSSLIRNTLLISNSLDYDIHIIRNLSRQYSPKRLADMSLRRDMYLYTIQDRIAGTVSVKDDMVYAFFIAPDMQRKGIGSQLLQFVEDRARENGVIRLKVGASVTARQFYAIHGYTTIKKEGDGSYGDVYYMEKVLRPKV